MMMMSGRTIDKIMSKKEFQEEGILTPAVSILTYRPVKISRSGRGRTSSRWDDDTDAGSIKYITIMGGVCVC